MTGEGVRDEVRRLLRDVQAGAPPYHGTLREAPPPRATADRRLPGLPLFLATLLAGLLAMLLARLGVL